VRYLILEVADRDEARRWLSASVSGRDDTIPQITTEEPWETKPDTTFNIGVTFEGRLASRNRRSTHSRPNTRRG